MSSNSDVAFSEAASSLLASRFNSLDELKTVIDISYGKTINNASRVNLIYKDRGYTIKSVLTSGINQEHLSNAQNSSNLEKIKLTICAPYAIRQRENLKNILLMARRRPSIFWPGDIAFYDLAVSFEDKITSQKSAYLNYKDSSEKGYINTFNHVNAQIFITALFSENIADYIADVHERYAMPELTTGNFSPEQLSDTINYPVDNYVDLINNEIGQEIGLALKKKYNLNDKTIWSPQLLTDFLNDIQIYYIRSMNICFEPFDCDEDLVIKFSRKINAIKNTNF
ncbi:hypothetical protein N8368_00420 [Bacteroidia bacterium]|nr:hypothetical protein [Bacteroidia bacterium]